MARLFVAVVPPEHVLEALAGLDRPAERGVRYTARDQWHVTLRFLGESDEQEATAALEGVSASPVEAALGPEVRRLGRSTVVVPARGLEALAASVVDATVAVGEPPDARPFYGHITLARLKHRGSCRLIGQTLSARFVAEEIQLVRSLLDPEGARYETVAVRRLG